MKSINFYFQLGAHVSGYAQLSTLHYERGRSILSTWIKRLTLPKPAYLVLGGI